MPDSPSFRDYARQPERFASRGMQILPQDALSEGKSSYLLNMRPYIEGTLTVREGWSEVSTTSLGDPVVSLFRLNDTTPFVDPAMAERIIAVSGASLFGASASNGAAVYGSIEAGVFSGNPVTGVVSAPFASPRPWVYIGDSDAMRKVNAEFTSTTIGIASPANEPTGIYSSVQKTFLNNLAGGLWVGYGGDATNPGAVTSRINTTVTAILYDEGAQPSMAAVALADMVGIVPGITVILAGATEPVVEEVHPAIATTTIAAIIYDTGPNGYCTIQPDNSLSQGQIEQAIPKEIAQRYTGTGTELPKVTVTRTVDYPVDSLVLVGGVEVVRILSVSLGQDGTMSFRCFTNGVFAAGAALAGIASFRAYVDATVNVGDAATADQLTNVITPPGTAAIVGGIQAPAPGGSRNWGLVGARATQPDDYIRFGIKVSSFENIESVRILLNMSDDTGTGGADFLHNYFFYEWRQNDLLEAIQTAVGAASALVSSRQRSAIQEGQVAGYYQDQYGFNQTEAGVIGFGADNDLFHDYAALRHLPLKNQTAQARAQQADNTVTVGSSISRQLAVGNEQWVVLQCRVGDLTRVGTDETLTINALNAMAITVQIAANTPASPAVTVSYSDGYLLGGYGPDVSVTWNPYVYRYRYRSTITGERSNFSPPMRAGLKPHRGQLVLSGAASAAVQCDVIDWFRLGGALARWAYVGTCDNAVTPTFADDLADRQIDGGATVDFDHYQPWPVSDQPRSGVGTLAGTALTWVSGDTFNTAWAEGSAIIVNGRATTLYKQPSSSTLLHVVENCGSGEVEFSLPEPTILSQPMRALWGGAIDGVVVHFACGDPSDPGALHWSQPNDPDATKDTNVLYATSASEPLINGCFQDGQPYVFSSERLFRITQTFGSPVPFRVDETGCTRGLWCPWAMCVTPYGIVFLSKDGVYVTSGGSEAIPLTDPDLRPVFPQDGSVPQKLRNITPIDFSQPAYIQMSYIDQLVYLDYLDTDEGFSTLVFDPRPTSGGWISDYNPLTGVRTRLFEPGQAVHGGLIGGENGSIYRMDQNKITDVLTGIPWEIDTRWMHGGDPRPHKQWGDAILDFNPCGSINGITVIPTVDNGLTDLTERILGAGGNTRATYLVEVGNGVGGEGIWSRNFGLRIFGEMDSCDLQRPIFYLWEPAWQMKQAITARRATDWEDLGYRGAKFVQGVVIRANTFGEDKEILVQFDGPNAAPQTGVVLTINHDGEQEKAYPLASEGWTPFVAQLVRLKGNDDVDWVLLEPWRFVWEPAPELATSWVTQYTTFDMPGFLHVFDGVMAYQATAAVLLTIEYQDGTDATYALPHNSGEYLRHRQIFESQKGKAVRFNWSSVEPFRLFKRDCSVRVQAWGQPGGYAVLSPFGGPSRVDGAGI